MGNRLKKILDGSEAQRVWKIVEGDNFGGDHPNEKFVNVPATTWMNASKICDAINSIFCNYTHAPRHWRVEKEDYKLQGGFEP